MSLSERFIGGKLKNIHLILILVQVIIHLTNHLNQIVQNNLKIIFIQNLSLVNHIRLKIT